MSISDSVFTPDSESPLEGLAGWITGILAGPATTSLCVIAVAVLGLFMLSGRMPIRRGGEVVMGCFLLFGAGTFALALRGLADDISPEDQAPIPLVIEREVPPLPPANYDPYAGASLRRDRPIE